MLAPMSPSRGLGLVVGSLLVACGADAGPVEGTVIGAAPAQFDYTIEAVGFDAWEGERLTIAVGEPGQARGRAELVIEAGRFAVRFRDLGELGLYKPVVLHADLDRDGACTGADLIGLASTPPFQRDELVALTPDQLTLGAAACARLARAR